MDFQAMACLVSRLVWVNCTQNITKDFFKHHQNLFQYIPDCPIIKKNSAKKISLGNQSSQKRGGGGVRRGMIMITDSMDFFVKPSLSGSLHSKYLRECKSQVSSISLSQTIFYHGPTIVKPPMWLPIRVTQ